MGRTGLSWRLLGLLLLAACTAERDEQDAPEPPFTLRAVSYDAIEGWDDRGSLAGAADALRLSCDALVRRPGDAPANPVERFDHPRYETLSGTVGDWKAACEAVSVLATAPEQTVREALERAFVPVLVEAEESLFTGYFEPSYEASRVPTPPYTAPVLTRPSDLVTVDLGDFREDLAGRDLVGRVEGSRLVPYADAAGIAAAPPETEALGYVDPNDLLFLQIQGSGRLAFPDGAVLRAGYAGKNGHPYVAVGRTLVRDGHMALEDVSMQSIRAWLSNATPDEAARVRHSNPSYVFFRELVLDDPDGGPLGAQGVQLTPGVSLAVDRRFHAMGLPVWLETEATAENPSVRRLMVAQDTGGAIRGPVRGDVFFGAGEAAARAAGTMNAAGRMILLMPRPVAAKVLGDEA